MKNGKMRIFTLIACVILICGAYSAVNGDAAPVSVNPQKEATKDVELKTVEDFDKALADAKAQKKIVMLHFTGSDWCPPCMMLHKKVVNTEEFAKYADKNLKVVVSDWSRGGGPKSKDFAKKHEQLASQYDLEGFPTIVLINPESGKTEKIVGFATRTPKDLIDRIEAFKK